VVVGILILSGAVNTAIVGSNGVLNRVSEDGILPEWFRHPHPRLGTSLAVITLTLFAIAITKLFTKQIATVSGASFTVVLFTVFTCSEWLTRERGAPPHEVDEFNLEPREALSPRTVGVRPGNIAVMVRDYNALHPLAAVLDRTAAQPVAGA
jgi:amino acid transporter